MSLSSVDLLELLLLMMLKVLFVGILKERLLIVVIVLFGCRLWIRL